jgi:DNA-binding MarR family transcriptional regulator
MDKTELIQAVGDAVQLFQEATDAFDYVAAKAMGLNQTDLKCLSIIFRKSPVAAAEVAQGSGLTRGAATTALDRIEAAGYAKRTRDPNDRRGVLLEATAKSKAVAGKLWGRMAEEGGKMLSRYSKEELETILRFLKEGTELQKAQTQEVLKKRS